MASGGAEWSERDHNQFMFAIKQPVLVQTPLQTMLEMLSDRMKAQTEMVTSLKATVDKLYGNAADHASLLERMAAAEAQLSVLPTAPMANPFVEHDVLERLKAVEWRAKEAMDTITGHTNVQAQVVASRLEAIEKRLAGGRCHPISFACTSQLRCIEVMHAVAHLYGWLVAMLCNALPFCIPSCCCYCIATAAAVLLALQPCNCHVTHVLAPWLNVPAASRAARRLTALRIR